jgi:hypothetical protein
MYLRSNHHFATATEMRPRSGTDGAITAYRNGRADATLETSDRRRFQMNNTVPRARERVTTIEIAIEVEGRWDALALSELLIPFHSFLVQHDQEHWVVHARAPGYHGEPLPDALEAIEEWRADRSAHASCRVDESPYQLSETKESVMQRIDHQRRAAR